MTSGVGVGRDTGYLRTVVGTSEPRGYLRPGVTLNPGEELATGAGHTEPNILDYISENGIEPIAAAAGRPICARCEKMIDLAGAVRLTS